MHLQIRPKCSISPKALMTVFGVLAVLSVTIGLVFWAMGQTSRSQCHIQ
jgi:uncharacterized membrane protein